MSRIREWIEECFSKELRDVPRKPKGAIHVIVYDSTQVPAAGAKTIGDRVRSAVDPSQSLGGGEGDATGKDLARIVLVQIPLAPMDPYADGLRGRYRAVRAMRSGQGAPFGVHEGCVPGEGRTGRVLVLDVNIEGSIDSRARDPAGWGCPCLGKTVAEINRGEGSVARDRPQFFRTPNTGGRSDGGNETLPFKTRGALRVDESRGAVRVNLANDSLDRGGRETRHEGYRAAAIFQDGTAVTDAVGGGHGVAVVIVVPEGDEKSAGWAEADERVGRGDAGPDGDWSEADREAGDSQRAGGVAIGDVVPFLRNVTAEADETGNEGAFGGTGEPGIVPAGGERQGEAEGQE